MIRIFKLLLLIAALSFDTFGKEMDVLTLAKSLNNKSDLNLMQIDSIFNSYKRDSVQMKQLATVSDFPMVKIFAINSLGIIARNTSQYKKSIDLHTQALRLSENISNQESIISSLNLIGVAYRRLDNVRLALDYHKQALALAEKMPDKTEGILRSTAVSLNSIGNIYLTLKQYELAQNQFEKSLEIEKKLDNKLGLAINYQNLGIIKEAQNELNDALENYSTSLEYNNAINSKLGKIICNNSIAQILIKMNKPKEGLKLILPSIKSAEELGDKFYITMALINSGWAYSILKDYANAEKNLMDGLKLAKANQFNSSTSEAYSHLAFLYESKGDYVKALENLKTNRSLVKGY